ncbi:MAG: DNA ligase [Geopsychrobacter sp.]|nr:DNA ligase [Geopsychrobacter sp.]
MRLLILILVLLSGQLVLGRPVAALEMMLPQVYTEQTDVAGWLMSEKLDGVRGYWDGKQLLSKQGNRFHPPQGFIRDLPPFALEGEIWGGRGRFEETVAIVKRQTPDPGWLTLKFAVFDVPKASGSFRMRMVKVKKWFEQHPYSTAFVIPQIPIRDKKHLEQELQRIEKLGGEGLIVRAPEALYTSGRSPKILKVKSFQDAEAKVMAYLPGKGKNRGKLGALLVEMADGTRFKIGSGFSTAERESPPSIGTIITFKYYGKFHSGIPRFASFLRIRSDQNL